MPDDKKKLDVVIKKIHAYKINVVIFGYDIGATIDASNFNQTYMTEGL